MRPSTEIPIVNIIHSQRASRRALRSGRCQDRLRLVAAAAMRAATEIKLIAEANSLLTRWEYSLNSKRSAATPYLGDWSIA
jgi:hypothetical protein